jgi:hypothetical protein
MLEAFTALATLAGSFRHSPVGPDFLTVRMKPSFGSNHSSHSVEWSEGFYSTDLDSRYRSHHPGVERRRY